MHKSRIIDWHNKLRNVEYQIKNSDNPRLWLEIHLTSLLENNSLKNTINQQITDKTEKADNNIKIQITANHSQKEECNNNEISSKVQNIEKKLNLSKLDQINETNTKIDEKDNNESNDLRDKWELILSKIELPSTRMLLSQQAELESLISNEIVIALSPNWENMIKSRKIVIEETVKKIFGNQMKIQFSSKDSQPPSSIIKKEVINNPKTIEKNNTNKNEKYEKNISENHKNLGSKNLADFFNGEIIDFNE